MHVSSVLPNNSKLFSIAVVSVYISSSSAHGPMQLQTPTLGALRLVGCWLMVLHCEFKLHVLIINEVEHLFHVFIGHLAFLFYEAHIEVFLLF